MVALKVQSLDGIVTAYVKSIGYCGENLHHVVNFLIENCVAKLNQDDVIASLDELLFTIVKKYLPSPRGDKTQALAMFKAVFLLHQGAEKCGLALFEKGELVPELQQILKENVLMSAPQVKMSKMEAQKIEPIRFFAVLGKIFHF